MDECQHYTVTTEPAFDRIVKKLERKDVALFRELDRGVEKILREPMLGKPLTNTLRNFRRIHIEGSFVLLYEVRDCVVRLIDFDHHDRTYKKYS